jgi:TolB-like protein
MILFSINCYAENQVVGRIIDNLDQKVRIMNGDKAVTNLGMNSGLIKGDILSVYEASDVNRLNVVGKCAVVDVYESKSICEVVKIYNNEIGRDNVVIDKISINDPNFYPVIFQLLTKIVEPYEPYKGINVYVHNIIDEQNNVTKFSENLRKEIRKVFSQKKRIKLIDNASPALFAYLPNDYAESNRDIEHYLKKDSIDVLIAGVYAIRGDKIRLNLYIVDKNYEDIVLDTTINATTYSESVSTVVNAYRPVRKEKAIVSEIVYKPIQQKIMASNERNFIIEAEAKNDPFFEYNIGRTNFNIISPVEFKMIIDNNEINFEKSRVQHIPMTTGKHEITAKFKKGYYYNDALLLTNDMEVENKLLLYLPNLTV